MNTWPKWVKKLFQVPVHNPEGIWVAKVWLDWEICRGSTLYRERFDSKEDAAKTVKKAAKRLDWWLPRGDFGIKYGVRKSCDKDTSRQIWSPYLPSSKHYCGEHRISHSLFGE